MIFKSLKQQYKRQQAADRKFFFQTKKFKHNDFYDFF